MSINQEDSVFNAPKAIRLPNPFTVAVPLTLDNWWVERHNGFNARLRQGKVDYIFIGDSITNAWETDGRQVWDKNFALRNGVNLGIGGDQTQHVLWRLTHGNLDGISPKVAVLMIGTNNFDHNVVATPPAVAEGVAAIVTLLRTRLPETNVLVYGIFPRSQKPSAMRHDILQANQIIHKLDDGKHVFYRDIGHRFIDANGDIPVELMVDYLHLSAQGYEVWADALNQHLAELE